MTTNFAKDYRNITITKIINLSNLQFIVPKYQASIKGLGLTKVQDQLRPKILSPGLSPTFCEIGRPKKCKIWAFTKWDPILV